jgi:predicted LPLAT superfamily acyltransferase
VSRPASWSSTSLGSRWQHEFFYRLIRLGGRFPAYLALWFVVAFYSLLPGVRARSRPYLARRFPGAGVTMLMLHAFRLNLEFGKVLVDRAAFGILGRGEAVASDNDKELFKSLLARGRGLLVLSAHAGAWQWAMSGLTGLGARLNVVYRRDARDVDRHYFEHSGDSERPRLIDPESDFGGVIEIMAALKRGEVVCAMADRVFPPTAQAFETPFMGGSAPLPAGVFAVAVKLGAPVCAVFSARTGPGRALVRVAGAWPDTLGADPAGLALGFAQHLEDFARREPYQFFNFFDMWTPRGGSR